VWTPPNDYWPGTDIYGLNDTRMIALYNAEIDEIATNYAAYIGSSNGNILEGVMFHEVDATEVADNHSDDVAEFSTYCQTNFSETYTTGTMPTTVDANNKWWRRYYLYKTSLVNNFMNQIKLNATSHNLKTAFIYYIPESAHGESWKWGYDVVGLENICDEMWVPGTMATDSSSGTDGAFKPYTNINNCYIDFGPAYQNQVLSQNYAYAFHGGPISWFWDRPAQYIDYIRSYYGDSQTWTQAYGDYYNDLLGVSEKELAIYLGQDNIANWISQMGYWQGGVSPARIAVAVNPSPFIMKYPSDPYPDYSNKVFTLTKSLYPFMDVDSLVIGSQLALNSNNLQQYSLIIIPEDMGDGLSQATVDALTAYKNAGGKILVVATPLTKSNPDLTGGVDQTSTFCGLTVAGDDTSTSTLQPASSTITLSNPNGGHWIDGKVGKALQFDGVDDYVNCGAGSSLDITDKLTIEAWIKPDTRSNYHVIACKNTYTYFFAVNSGKLSLLIGNSSANGWNIVLVGDMVLNSSNWYHVAGTYDSTTGEAKLYINGVLAKNATGTAQAIGSKPTGWLSVGCAYGSAYYFNGVIDELNIYPMALGADEIALHYQDGLMSDRINGRWLFDDGQGMFLQDFSRGRNMGALQNMDGSSCWTTGKIGGALAFDGTDGYVDCGAGSTLNITEPLTLEAWVKFDSLTDNAKPLDNGLYRLIYSSTDGKLHFQYRITDAAAAGDSQWNYWSGVKTITSIQTGQWYHVTGSKTGNTMKLYLNGVKERELTCLTGYTVDNSQISNLILGDNPFCGKLDELRIYTDAAFTDDTIMRDAKQPIAGRWALDETQGTTTTDRSGNSNNGTLTNMTAPGCWVSGKIGKALAFDGVNDYVNCGSGSSLDITDKLTIEAWIKPDTRGSFHVIACKNTYTYFFSTVSYGKLELLIGNSSSNGWNVGVLSNTVMNSNNWYHVAGTYDSATGEAKLYINGVLDNTATGTAQAIGSKPAGWLSVGCAYGSAYYFNGVIDELNIYPRLLSADELAGHSSILTAGQWALDDGQDSSVQDISGHGAAGTMNNFSSSSSWLIQPTRRKTINNTGATTVVSDYATSNPLLLQNGNVYFSTIGAENLSTGYWAQVIDYIADPPVKLTDNTGISIIEATRKDNALCVSFSGPGTATLKVDTAGCGLSGSTFDVKEILTGRTLCSSISSTDLDNGFKINIKYYDEPYVIAIGSSGDLAGFTGIFDSEETFEITSPDGWTTAVNDSLDTPAGWARDYAHAGTKSLKIVRTLSRTAASQWTGKTMTFSSPYPTTFTFGGWAKADSVGTGALFALQYDIVYSDYTTETYDADTRFDTGTHDWQQVNYVKTFSKGIKSITPKCVLSGANGTAWFDDLYINLNGANLLYNGGVEILK
ncbi:MAG: LamG domain-containing protein, partial [bacterium]|nr:LamG domain-containing protein [bacterium]